MKGNIDGFLQIIVRFKSIEILIFYFQKYCTYILFRKCQSIFDIYLDRRRMLVRRNECKGKRS